MPRAAATSIDDLHNFLDDLGSFRREPEEMGEPPEKIDAKDTLYMMDAMRHIVQY